MIQNILKIRLLQLFRILKDIGLIYVVILILLIAVFSFFFYTQLNLFPNCILAVIVLASIAVTIQLSRKDRGFIKMVFRKTRILYFIEYTVLSLPFVIMIILSANWYVLALLLVLYLLIAQFDLKRKLNFKFIKFGCLIPDDNFEWTSGLRRTFPYMIALYLLALGLSFYPYASLFIIWLILSVIASFYNESEPYNVLIANELPANEFVNKKLLKHLKLYIIFTIPVILVYSIFNWQTYFITIIFYILSLITVAFFILTKYANYDPGYKMKANGVYTALALLSIFIPFLVPLPIFLSIRNYNRSISNLNHYLNAYHK